VNLLSVRNWLKTFLMRSRSEPTPKKVILDISELTTFLHSQGHLQSSSSTAVDGSSFPEPSGLVMEALGQCTKSLRSSPLRVAT
jgi:hypothetical protein